jgi:hypothetical protein
VRTRAAAVVLVALTATASAVADASAQQGLPGPPPLAFRSATLHRPHHAIEVRMQAMSEVRVRVTIRRHGRRLGRSPGAVHQGRSIVRVVVRHALLRRLRVGQHVDVIIDFGAVQPIVIYGAMLHRRHPAESLLVA